MAVYKQPKSKYWWYKFVWNGEPIRESTKQANKRVAEQLEAAHRTALAKGEVGIRERKTVPMLNEFAGIDFFCCREDSRFVVAEGPATIDRELPQLHPLTVSEFHYRLQDRSA